MAIVFGENPPVFARSAAPPRPSYPPGQAPAARPPYPAGKFLSLTALCTILHVASVYNILCILYRYIDLFLLALPVKCIL